MRSSVMRSSRLRGLAALIGTAPIGTAVISTGLIGAAAAQTACGSTHYGRSTPGSGNVAPRLTTIGGWPLLGSPGFGLHAEALAGGAVTVRWLGLAPTSIAAPGFELLVDAPVFALATASGAGLADFPLPIPAAPALADVALFAQVAAVDPGAAGGVAASDGLRFVLRQNNLLGAVAVYQGAAGSDAFSSIHDLGKGRIIAGKRSSQAHNRFLLSLDHGASWRVVGCPGSTGAHTYFFGQNGATVLAGTGDTGAACIMRSADTGASWSVALGAVQIQALIGSASALAVFGPVHMGRGRWLANVKSFDARASIVESLDDGRTWRVAAAQPGSGASAWARRMVLTHDGVLLWPEATSDRMYRSTDQGASWTPAVVPGASLFQPLCDAGRGVYLCGDVRTTPNTAIRLYRSLDRGLTWSVVASVNLQRPTLTYWRDVVRAGGVLYASACCQEGTSQERFMQLFRSLDDGATWCSLGNPYQGPYGGMQAVYQMCATAAHEVFAACQPDSTILRWSVVPDGR